MSPFELLNKIAEANDASVTFESAPIPDFITINPRPRDWTVTWSRSALGRTGPEENVVRYNGDLTQVCEEMLTAISGFDLKQPKE